MIDKYAEFLAPASKWVPLLEQGVVRVNEASNRVAWADTGRYAGAYYPVMGNQVAQRVADLPLQPQRAMEVVQESADLSSLAPALQQLQLLSSIGALASVANLGVSCVGFALVLQRLGRIEGKLDQLLGEVEYLKTTVDAIHTHVTALSMARVRAAGESLERALSADSASVRRESVSQARSLFKESKALYLQLWERSEPMYSPTVPIVTAMEMQARYVTAAIGEIQAEFIGGDAGAYRLLVSDTVRDMDAKMKLNPIRVLRERSDAACDAGPTALGTFQAELHTLSMNIRIARDTAIWTIRRVAGLADDIDTARQIGLEPFEMARLVRSVPDNGLFLLGTPESIKQLQAA